ncbi:MAG: VWA domain-containing protein [Promethearchaeota archaeon]|nr:MAG: VWA domain-containing protein [Candidatus Lokiarchaeota archaeon]
MQDWKLEDTVLLLDTSRSMLRKDFKPSRLILTLKAAKNFIIKKFSIDPKDRISIITFGGTVKKLIGFSLDQKKLIETLQKIKISGKGDLHDGIAFALQILVEEMRKIGGKTNRIVIISDNKMKQKEKLDKIINIVTGLGIFIDALQIGGAKNYRKSPLRRISKITGGEFGYFNNSEAILYAGKEFASKKEAKSSTDYFSSDSMKKSAPLVSEIALSLRRPTLMEIRLMMSQSKENEDKCQICHSNKSPITNADFYAEGRYCPSCERPMHLSCAALWAQKSELKENIFRCPFCYLLLKVPASALNKINRAENQDKNKIKIIEANKNTTRMAKVPDVEITSINASCSYCHSIFLGDYEVFQCENCKSYYHKPCLEKMYKEIKACRFCGSSITYD